MEIEMGIRQPKKPDGQTWELSMEMEVGNMRLSSRHDSKVSGDGRCLVQRALLDASLLMVPVRFSSFLSLSILDSFSETLALELEVQAAYVGRENKNWR